MSGAIQLMQGDKPVPGPYTQEARENWMRKLLAAQTWIRRNGPAGVRNIELISLDELQEIRRLWVVEKHEMEDRLPRIYSEVTGEPYPGRRLDDNLVLGENEMEVLKEVCGGDRLHYELARELLSVERQQRAHARRAGLFDQLEKSIRRHYYDDKEDATDMARRHAQARTDADKGQRTAAFIDDSGGFEARGTQTDVLP
jgi:DNA sulfur modification protein DndC